MWGHNNELVVYKESPPGTKLAETQIMNLLGLQNCEKYVSVVQVNLVCGVLW
jgi:hypothetical protein